MSAPVFNRVLLAVLAVVVGCGIALRLSGNELFLYPLVTAGLLPTVISYLKYVGFFEVFKIKGPTDDQQKKLVILGIITLYIIIMVGVLRTNDGLREINKALKNLDVPLSTLK